MTVPNLIHPIDVVVRLLNREGTTNRDFFREPVGKAKRSRNDILVPGQVFDQDNINRTIETGLKEITEGYVVFRVIDLLRAEMKLQVGDRIVSFGSDELLEPVNLYFYRFRRKGHYRRGRTLVHGWYADKSPTRIDESLGRVVV